MAFTWLPSTRRRELPLRGLQRLEPPEFLQRGPRVPTPMPDDALAAQRAGDQHMNIRGSFDPLAITLTLPDGTPAAPPQHLNPRFSTPTFGRPS